ncbi:MAG: ATP-dependent RecD-like DNA helicase [Clostridiales Family XIII bacterium]|nr:ATP-dependent RecD-like DNA helicase [Clostridiales Family XIII bacterium]
MEEKSGILTELIYQNPKNGYTVAVFKDGGSAFTGVGCAPGATPGRRFRLAGAWKEHASYGRQFAFSEYSEEMPDTNEGIELFLASGALKGVGPKLAGEIVRAFGDEALGVIEREPHRLTEVDGIGPKKAASICESFRERREFAETTLYFQQYGVSPQAAMKLYSAYGAGAIAAMRENPYRIIDDALGIGFRYADRVALKMGIEKDSAFRLKSGLKYLLRQYAGDGSAFVPKGLLLEKAAQLLDAGSEGIEESLTDLVFEGEAHIEDLEGRQAVFLEPYYEAERSVCKNLIRLANAGLKPIMADVGELIGATERASGISLADCQRAAVRESLASGVFVITGGPGTGKTTIIDFIIRILRSGGFKASLAAPTGRAAKRISETTGCDASTIHRLLEYFYLEDEDRMCFGRTAENPLDCDALIVDEASMVDIMLMKGLLEAMPSGARLIMVGDADQLPSIGAGDVLRDMLNSEIICSVRLTEIFRQAKESLIVVNAHRINRGECPVFNAKDRDFFFLRRDGEAQTLSALKELCATRLPAYYGDCDVARDLQMLTPARKGPLGSVSLNRELQAILNPPREGAEEHSFGERLVREGDMVLQVRNNYRMTWRRAGGPRAAAEGGWEEGEGVFNGDIGFIEAIDRENGLIAVVFDENRHAEYDFTQIDDLELAYAITVHKSQGSEFPLVLMPMAPFPPMLATRNLFYTAVTRGKRAVILVGAEGCMRAMVERGRTKERYSGLCARLRAFLPKAGDRGGEWDQSRYLE